MAADSIISLPAILCQLFNACSRVEVPQFGEPMVDVTAIRGMDATFSCQVVNLGKHLVAFVRADPTIVLTWNHRVFASRPHKYSVDVKGDRWFLKIRNVQQSDQGLYMCQINTSPMLAQMAYLHLKVPPRVDTQLSTHDLIVQEGQDVTFSCVANGSPTPTVSWRRKDGEVIVTNEPEGYGGTSKSIIYKQNLTLYKVNRKHMSEYLCLASNNVPPDESWSLKLHVHFAPSVVPLETTVSSKTDSTAHLACMAEAWPKPDFTWEFQENVILPNDEKYKMVLLLFKYVNA
ncbi:unnamed protein product [Soboliphyme baturini]|uniref:Lachesin-like n=1 Tax=Soboliphyme baturini TaxID=241478 RepID=A0A183INJ8_9BILA|nr:unnamed protein product [Soboliphyme baturini]